jgi:hypothetical protein
MQLPPGGGANRPLSPLHASGQSANQRRFIGTLAKRVQVGRRPITQPPHKSFARHDFEG